ncbi:MAG: peroxiredoxin [Fuerstiella sp.]
MRQLIVPGIVSVLLTGAMNMSEAGDLKVGDEAPAFELKGSDGKTYKLSDFHGKSTVVVAWFPKAFTGGCTKECKSFRANGEAIREYEVKYFTASCDTVDRNTEFAKSLELDYPILSDPGKQVAEAYGVVHEGRANPERWTFVIGEDGKIRHIDKKVRTDTHGEDLVSLLAELKVPKK